MHNNGDPNFNSASDFTQFNVSPANLPSFPALTGGRTTLPASFLSGAGASNPYLLAFAEHNAPHSGQDDIEFWAYDLSGNRISNFGPGNQGFFEIAPNLLAYGQHFAGDPTVHNQITLEADDGTHTGRTTPLFFVQPGGTGPIYVAWNETVTVDGDPHTYDQVEFVRHATGLPTVDQYFTYPIADGQAQNIKLQTHGFNNGTTTGTIVILAFGDNTSTTVKEFFFNTTNNANTITEIGSYTEATPNGQIYTNMRDLGDGRVAIIYDDQIDGSGTTEASTNIVDFRTTGLTPTTPGVGTDQKYFAGTQFNDNVIGQNSAGGNFASNEYYYVGSNAGGAAPTDTFTGGTNAVNIAILPGNRADYNVLSSGNGSATVTKTGANAGTLNTTGVQALAFGPSNDPLQTAGVLEASAGTLYIAGSLNIPVAIDSGATVEFNAPNNGLAPVSITFLDTGGILKLDNPPTFTGKIILDGRVNGTSSVDTLDIAGISVTSASVAGTTLTVNLTGGGQQSYQVIGAKQGAIAANNIHSDGAGGTNLDLTPVGALWGTFAFPAQPTDGTHLYVPQVANAAFGSTNFNLLTTFFAQTTAGYTDSGPDTITSSIFSLDPFLLPYRNGSQQIATTTVKNFPDHQQQTLLLNLGGGQFESLGFYITEDASGTAVINQVTITPGANGLNGPLTISASTPVITGLTGSDLFFTPNADNDPTSNLFSGPNASYSLAWSQYNNGTFTIDYENFNVDGTSSTLGVKNLLTTTVASPAQEPAWSFRGAGVATGNIPIYGLALATHNQATNSDFIQFQSYDKSGNPIFNFSVQPILLAGVTTQITQEPQSTDHTVLPVSLFFTPNVGAGSGLSFAWNDTLMSGGNTVGDQVEFQIYHSGVLFAHQEFQIPDGNAQNIRLFATNIPGTGNVELLAYGDDTGTHVVEFDSNGVQLASIFDPSTQTFGQFTIMGDGRIAILYDNPAGANGTTQYVTHIYDLRQAGLNTTLSGGADHYVAGTQFNDSVTGEAGVNNTYYYDGGSADSFTGGASPGWNIAINDARSDYAISNPTGTFNGTVTNISTPSHALTVTNVQELVFDPVSDPAPQQNGTIVANGGTTVLLGPVSHDVTLSSNSTLELPTPQRSSGKSPDWTRRFPRSG